MKKKIRIIYTGGTIGMVKTYNGYAPRSGYLEPQLDTISDLHDVDMPLWDLVEFDPLLDSSNVAYNEWNKIGRVIADNYGDYDGFVVLHGTDTMAYCASALSFMLDGLRKPVVFTGSQIPLCELRSDGRENLITSMLIAADGTANEVCLYFGHTLLRGNRATKSSADNLIAFTSPNYPPLASAGVSINYNRSSLFEIPDQPLKLTEIRHHSIGVIKMFPGIQFGLFEPILTNDLDALILETFGAGNIPSHDSELPVIIKRALSSGAAVLVRSQCPQGSVRLGIYEAGSSLAKAGAISGYDISTEAAIGKLYYLFSRGIRGEKLKYLMEKPLRGELSI